MDKLRYINLGQIDPPALPASWTLFMTTLFPVPTLLIYTMPRILILANILPLSQQFNHQDIPPDLPLGRLNIPIKDPSNALFEHGTLGIILSVPDDMGIQEGQRALQAACVSVLRNKGLDVEYPGYGNDLFLGGDLAGKKFSGCHSFTYGNNTKTGLILTFDFDIQLAKRLYNLTTKKFTKKGQVKDISHIVGGLHEMAPDLDAGEVASGVATALAVRLGLELQPDNFTVSEETRRQELRNKLQSQDWIENAIWPK